MTLRIALSVVALAAGWWLLGPFGLLITAAVPAFLLARPALALVSGAVRGARTLALQAVEGTYFEFRGVPVAVYEDEQQRRWLATAAIRALLPSFPRDAVLQRVFPSGVASPDKGAGPAVRADELIAFLSRAERPEAVRFKTWVQREVYYPSASAKRAGATPTSALNGEIGS